MSKYDPERHRIWYLKNRERLLEVRKKYNKEYFARPEVIEHAKVRNAQRRQKRKEYKKTEQGREAERRYWRGKYYRDKKTGRDLFKRYGLTKEGYDELFLAQGEVCAICGEKKNYRLHVDHCHETSVVRGLLCGNCNRALGLLKDNPGYLLSAIEYLENGISKNQSGRQDFSA